MRSEVILLGLAIWFGFGAAVALLSRRFALRSSSDFFIAGRGIGGAIAAMTYSATTYSAFMMVGLVGYVYATGVGAIGFELTYLLGTMILLAIFAPRFWLAGRLRGYISPAELLSERYGSKFIGALFALVSLVMLIPYSSVQFMGIAYLLETVSGGEISFISALLIAYLIVLLFTLWGLRSVAWTDALQASIMLFSSLLFLGILLSKVGGLSNLFSTLETSNPELLYANSWSFMKFLGLTTPWFFFALSNPQVSQRLFIAKNARSLRTMILGFSAFGLIYTLIVGLIGLSSRIILPGVPSSDLVMPTLLASESSLIALIVLLVSEGRSRGEGVTRRKAPRSNHSSLCTRLLLLPLRSHRRALRRIFNWIACSSSIDHRSTPLEARRKVERLREHSHWSCSCSSPLLHLILSSRSLPRTLGRNRFLLLLPPPLPL